MTGKEFYRFLSARLEKELSDFVSSDDLCLIDFLSGSCEVWRELCDAVKGLTKLPEKRQSEKITQLMRDNREKMADQLSRYPHLRDVPRRVKSAQKAFNEADWVWLTGLLTDKEANSHV